MPLKTKFKRVEKSINDLIPDIEKEVYKDLAGEIADIIVEQVTSGVSPVKGQNRYPAYSEEYAKKKGRKQPVDLVKSGKMLENLRARITRNGVTLEFPSKAQREKFEGHQFGANGLPVRKILPVGRGEKFKQKILDKIIRIAQKSVNEVVDDAN